MDCKTARQLLDFARPQVPEIESAEAEALQEHLADCPDCGGLAQAERRVDYHLGQAMRAVPVPEGLKGRLLGKLALEHRAAARRWWLRRLGVAGAAAACLLVVVGAVVWQQTRPPALDTDALAQQVVIREVSNLSARKVQANFQDFFGVETTPPSNFNYNLLRDYALVVVQGKRVPRLVFETAQQQAKVYIIADGQFDLSDVPRQSGDGSITARVAVQSGGRAYTYVIVYTGESYQPFLRDDEPPGA